MNAVKPDQSSHWYTKTGEPRYEATLREARKEILLPSVTTYLNVLAKPELEAWKTNQAILAALTLPRILGESEEAYCRRIVTDSKAQTSKAADFGTRCHKMIEDILDGKQFIPDSDLIPWYMPVKEWLANNIVSVVWKEKILVGKDYAGKADILVYHKTLGLCLMDFKTQKTKKDAKGNRNGNAYDTWGVQLSAYHECIRFDHPPITCVNVIICSEEPNYIYPHVWDAEDIRKAFLAFEDIKRLWKWSKSYEP